MTQNFSILAPLSPSNFLATPMHIAFQVRYKLMALPFHTDLCVEGKVV